MNRLKSERRAAVVRCLVEGNSLRATVRMTGAAKNTVVKLLVELGHVCSAYQDEALRGITAKRIQCDEIWSFVGCKEKNLPPDERFHGSERGDVWTWTAIDADTKIVLSWCVGERDTPTAKHFIGDLASRVKNRVQLTTDGHRPYLEAIEESFGADIDYAMLIKLYGKDDQDDRQRRYSPAICLSATPTPITGDPDDRYISTSFVERQNLTMRMQMRRFTRLTNAFSKKMENHAAAIALHFMHYNFARPHQTLSRKTYPTTPAMAAGVADHVWTVEEIVALLSN